MPIYTGFSNAQLAAMVSRRVRTLSDLGEIEGIGAARVERYGGRLLGLLSAAAEVVPAAAPAAAPASVDKP